MNSLIIGIEGQIGNVLYNIFDVFKCQIYGTTIFSEFLAENCTIFDLSKDISSWTPPTNISTAYICAAICSIKECEENPGKCRVVNVDNTVKLAEKLIDSGAFVVFPSSNMVFNGQRFDYKENDIVCPLNEYGRQKVETEKKLLKTGNCAIVRFTKLIGPNFSIIKNWINDLRNNNPIYPFSDMKMAPVSLHFAADVMKVIGESKSSGIWHVSNNTEISYEEAARHIARKLNVSESLIEPVTSKDKGVINIQTYSTLDTNKIFSAFNIKSPDTFTVINSQFGL